MVRFRSPGRRRQRGAAALIVVVVLFFLLALVSAYTGRNLVFEQRVSANNLRATQAFEAAEAGIEFAVAALGGGRVDAACVATTNTAQTSFRQRHTTQDGASGNFIAVGGQPNLRPTCMVLANGSLNCSCPAAGVPNLAPPVGPVPTFQLEFQTGGIAQPGILRVVSRGCSSFGSQCYNGAPTPPVADATAEVSVLLGLNSGLATPPNAALTARGSVNLGGSAVTISNGDVPSGGVTVNSGGALLNAGTARLLSVPGTPGSASVQASDPSLVELDANRMFVSLFGMDKTTYRTQPAVVRLNCNGNCAQTIADAVSANPGRMIWVDGDVTFDTTQVIGSAAEPVLLVVHGNLTASANLQLHGLLYLYTDGGATSWNTAAGATLVQGAVVAEGNLTFVGTPTISFDPAVLRTINLTQGSLVRIPGSWRDFAAGS